MSKPLSGVKIAILAANGFNQQNLTDTQKSTTAAGAALKIICPDQGLVNGWEGQGWGHHFAVDQVLSTALGADFDMLAVLGGSRSIEKLKTTAHTKRVINSFMTSGKPVVMFEDAVDLLAFAGQDTVVENHSNLYVVNAENPVGGMLDFFISNVAPVQKAA
jgi:protease I